MHNESERIGKPVRPTLQWELNSGATNLLLKLARENAEQHVQKYRLRLIELARFDPQPQRYDLNTSAFGQFDNHTKEDRMNDQERWIARYEQVARFCLKMEAVVSHYEAEQFGEQIAQMFSKRK